VVVFLKNNKLTEFLSNAELILFQYENRAFCLYIVTYAEKKVYLFT